MTPPLKLSRRKRLAHLAKVALHRFRGLPRSVAELDHSLSILADLRALGWQRSIRSGPVCDGAPIPWLTYPAIFWLETLDLTGQTVFEYGAGHSTLWFAQRAARVFAVEQNPQWLERITRQARENVSVELMPHSNSDQGSAIAYASALRRATERLGRPFDIVMIDGGPKRSACAPVAIESLANDGILIFDDTELPMHATAVRGIQARGFYCIDFPGASPGTRYFKITSALSRSPARLARGPLCPRLPITAAPYLETLLAREAQALVATVGSPDSASDNAAGIRTHSR
jgi:hypothetical protein